MAIFKVLLVPVLGLAMTWAAAAQDSNQTPKLPAKDQVNAPNAAKKQQPDSGRVARPMDRDPDRSAIGPRTTQGLAQDAISRSNSR